MQASTAACGMAFDLSNPSTAIQHAYRKLAGAEEDASAKARRDAFGLAVTGMGGDPFAEVRRKMGLDGQQAQVPVAPAVDPSRKGLDLSSGRRSAAPRDPAPLGSAPLGSAPLGSPAALSGGTGWRNGVEQQAFQAGTPGAMWAKGSMSNALDLQALQGRSGIANDSRQRQSEIATRYAENLSALTKGEREQAGELAITDRNNQTDNTLRLYAGDADSQVRKIAATGEALQGVLGADYQGRGGLTAQVIKGGLDAERLRMDPTNPANLTAAGYNSYMTSLGEAAKTSASAYEQALRQQSNPLNKVLDFVTALAPLGAIAFGGRG